MSHESTHVDAGEQHVHDREHDHGQGHGGHGHSHEEPEPRQSIALGEQLGRVEFLPGDAGGCAVAGGGFARAEFGGFHRFQ